MRIVAIGTGHLPFPDGMMGWQLSECENVLMALVANRRIIHRHRQSSRTRHRRVAEIGHRLDVRSWVGIVTICALHAHLIMDRGMPTRRGRRLMALQAERFSGELQDIAVRVVTALAVKTVRTVDLVWMSDFLEIVLVTVTAVAHMRNNGPQVIRRPTQGR